MLDFIDISLEMKPIVDRYGFEYGKGSCQHSFASSFCLQNKYHDKFVEKNDFLYTFRSGISDEKERVYLFPLGNLENENGIKEAISEILDDAHKNNSKVLFKTINETEKDVLYKYFSDKFNIEDSRDYYEYIYNTSDLAKLAGTTFQQKRNAINKLIKTYGESLVIKKIEEDDIDKIKKFYYKWIEKVDDYHRSYIKTEVTEFDLAIENYKILELLGIVIYVDNEVIGFNFGSKVSDDTYDGMIQKGNISYRGIYELLNNRTAKEFASEIQYMNFEEDLGVEGLRKAKLIYNPIFLMKKYIAMEV